MLSPVVGNRQCNIVGAPFPEVNWKRSGDSSVEIHLPEASKIGVRVAKFHDRPISVETSCTLGGPAHNLSSSRRHS